MSFTTEVTTFRLRQEYLEGAIESGHNFLGTFVPFP